MLGRDAPGGRLFRRGDENALSDALGAVLGALPVEREGARQLADRVVRDYDWDAATDATEELYASLLARRSSVLLRAAGPRVGRSAPGEL